jgi:hypothetical protein
MDQDFLENVNYMKKQGCYPEDELEHLGNGDLDKGIEGVKKQGWTIVSITLDHNSNQKFYNVEKKY